jgi:predicted nucleic acid-binding Zn ribbon protein
VGIIFKGSGFHVTDYRKPEESAADEPKKEPARKASSKDQDSD